MSANSHRSKIEAHNQALQQDLSDQYHVGQQLDLVILESPEENNGRDAYARHDDVSVFIRPKGNTLPPGTHIRAKISEKGDNHLKAITMAILE